MSSLPSRGLDAATTQAATSPALAAGGSAHGSTAKAGRLLASGRTAYVPLCTTRVGSAANRTARVDLGAVGQVGAATNADREHRRRGHPPGDQHQPHRGHLAAGRAGLRLLDHQHRHRPARRPRLPHAAAATGHPRGVVPVGSPPAAPLAVALLGMLVVLGGLTVGAVALVVHLLGGLGG